MAIFGSLYSCSIGYENYDWRNYLWTLVTTTDPAHVLMTAHAMGNAAPAWHTTVTTMRVFQDASFPKKRRQPTTGALRIWQGIMDCCNKFWIVGRVRMLSDWFLYILEDKSCLERIYPPIISAMSKARDAHHGVIRCLTWVFFIKNYRKTGEWLSGNKGNHL